MILVDTSVWIDYFNGVEHEQTDRLDTALAEDIVAMGDLILLEILQGFHSDKDYRRAKDKLELLAQHDLFGYSSVANCAENYRALRKKGITIRKTANVIIATFCIDHELPLLFSDRDFRLFVDHLGLIEVL